MKQVFSDIGQQAEQDSEPWERLKKKKKQGKTNDCLCLLPRSKLEGREQKGGNSC